MFGQRTFFSIIELVFRQKREFSLFYYNTAIAYFLQTQSNIEIDVIVIKKRMFLKLVNHDIRNGR